MGVGKCFGGVLSARWLCLFFDFFWGKQQRLEELFEFKICLGVKMVMSVCSFFGGNNKGWKSCLSARFVEMSRWL